MHHDKYRDVFTIIGLAVCAKSLLVYSYLSTDFEVHRNWLAITHSLPINKWYTEATSEWTLDYPPLFAWFEYFLSQVAAYVDPGMLNVQSLNYKSHGTVMFQKFSVIITDFVLVYAAVVWHDILFQRTHKLQRLFQPVLLVGLILNPGLLIVDHMHFQYNGILMGLMLLSLARIYEGKILWGAFWFCVLLNMKHIYLYIAPPFFFYLLRVYVLEGANLREKVTRLTKLGSIVVAVFAVSFGPFVYHGQLPQLASRLFPVKRGLLHAYWAPNFWSFYAGADKVSAVIMGKLGFNVGHHSLTSGLVQESSFAVLPNVPSYVTMILAAFSMLPSCIRVYRSPDKNVFMQAVIYCGFSSFFFGYHVHEKAILIPLLCMLPSALMNSGVSAVFILVAAVGHFSLLPLIITKEETFIKIAFMILYQYYMHEALRSHFRTELVNFGGRIYLFGFIPLFIYAELMSKFITPRMEFLPLMVTSLYCAFGILCAFMRISILHLFPSSEKMNP